jgi:Class II flagellar assembly regulator
MGESHSITETWRIPAGAVPGICGNPCRAGGRLCRVAALNRCLTLSGDAGLQPGRTDPILMRIESKPPTVPTSRRRDAASGSGSGPDFSVGVSEDQAASAPAAARPMSSVDGLFLLQELPDALAERRRAVKRAGSLLDRLDELRLALLTGNLPMSQIAELQRVVASTRGTLDDPRLLEVLDEIELRARVELAKLAPAS